MHPQGCSPAGPGWPCPCARQPAHAAGAPPPPPWPWRQKPGVGREVRLQWRPVRAAWPLPALLTVKTPCVQSANCARQPERCRISTSCTEKAISKGYPLQCECSSGRGLTALCLKGQTRALPGPPLPLPLQARRRRRRRPASCRLQAPVQAVARNQCVCGPTDLVCTASSARCCNIAGVHCRSARAWQHVGLCTRPVGAPFPLAGFAYWQANPFQGCSGVSQHGPCAGATCGDHSVTSRPAAAAPCCWWASKVPWLALCVAMWCFGDVTADVERGSRATPGYPASHKAHLENHGLRARSCCRRPQLPIPNQVQIRSLLLNCNKSYCGTSIVCNFGK